MVFDIVQLKDNEAFVQQVQFLVGVQQVVVFAATIVRFKHVQEAVNVKVLFPDVLPFQLSAVIIPHKLVERVEAGRYRFIFRDTFDVGAYRIGQRHFLRPFGGFIVPLPKGKDKRLDALFLLDVKHPVLDIERVERYRVLVGVREINPVLAVCAVVDKPGQPQVAVSRIYQQHVRTLLVILAYHVVGEEGLSRPARPKYELVAVGRDALLHGQVGYVDVQRSPAHPVRHLDAERGKRTLVVGFLHEQAESLPQERVEAFLRREVRFIAGYARPKERGHVHRVVAWLALHQGKLASHIVAYALDFLPVIAPCHDVAVAAHRDKPLAVRFVQVFVYPFLVHLVGTGVAGERLHVPGGLLEVFQVLGVVVYEDVLVIDMVARQQHAHRSGETQPAIAPVGGELFKPEVRAELAGQVLHVRKGVQAQDVIADAHFLRVQPDVLQRGGVGLREREVFLDDARPSVLPGDFRCGQPGKRDETAVVHDALELPDRLDEFCYRFLVRYLLRDNPAPAERGEVALSAASFFGRLGQEQITIVVQKRSFVEMPLITPGQEAEPVLFRVGLVVLRDEEVLLVYDGVAGQHLDRLVPCRMDGFVFGTGDGEQFGQFHPESHRDVRILRDDAAVFHRQKRELPLQRGSL